jgi:SAM-dependent methyltransferase
VTSTSPASPRVSGRWEQPQTVAGFAAGVPNDVLVAFAAGRRQRRSSCLDIGSGAARNATALAELGYQVVAADLSAPMLAGARERLRTWFALPQAQGAGRIDLVLAPMAPLPFRSGSFDLIVAHGIWNLARSDRELREAMADAGRVARPGAGLFLFTFSRHTLPDEARPDPGESFTFSCWNGEPACFLTEDEIVTLLAEAGFVRETPEPLTEYNRPRPGELRAGGPPVIYEGTFVRR